MKVLLIAYDNDSYIHHFPLGLAYIASALRRFLRSTMSTSSYIADNASKLTLAIIPARGGSKSVPRKNVRLLAGKPLIAQKKEK